MVQNLPRFRVPTQVVFWHYACCKQFGANQGWYRANDDQIDPDHGNASICDSFMPRIEIQRSCNYQAP